MDTLDHSMSSHGIATIRFNRPEKANSYDQTMLDRLGDLLEQVRDDARVRVVVLRGAGRHFSAGAEIDNGPAVRTHAAARQIIDVCKQLDDLPKPSVALVQGACIGGALALACCCDTLIAERQAIFSIPEVRLGFAPGPLVAFFVRAMGHRAVRHYLLSGERFSGEEALRLGLAHQCGDATALDRLLDKTVDGLLLGAPGAQARAKSVLQSTAVAPIDLATLQHLQTELDRMGGSPEAMEGRASFAEKRKPRWYPPHD